MSKKLVVIIAIIIVAVIVVTMSITSTANDTFMETRVKYAMKYTKENKDDLELFQKGNQLIADQTANIDALKTEYNEGEFTLENPYVAVDPYMQNNLAAYIVFNSDEKISYTYTVEAKDKAGYPFTYTSEDALSGDIVIPVVGLYEDYANQVTITTTNEAGDKNTSTVTVQTEKAESNYSEGAFNASELEKEAGLDGVTDEMAKSIGEDLINVTDATVKTEINDESLMDYSDGFILTEDNDIYDMDGNLRFSSIQGAGNNPIKDENGRYLIISADHIMYEMDYMGKIYNFYVPPVSDENNEEIVFHHDAAVSADGKYIYVLSGFNKTQNIEENAADYKRETLIIKYNRETAEAVDVFDYYDEFGQDMQSMPVSDVADPLHMNSIDYYEEANQLIVSMKNQSLIMGVDAKSGEVDWMIKDPAAVSEENQDLLLQPVNEEEMIYTSGNHTAFPMYTSKYMTEGDDLYLSVFDNRFCVNEDQTPAWSTFEEDTTCATSKESSMVIYHINFADNTVETVEEIVPQEGRWSNIRSSVYTVIDGIYAINYADLATASGNPIAHSDLYVVNTDGEVLSHTTFDGMTNEYRARLINQDEIGIALTQNIDNL